MLLETGQSLLLSHTVTPSSTALPAKDYIRAETDTADHVRELEVNGVKQRTAFGNLQHSRASDIVSSVRTSSLSLDSQAMPLAIVYRHVAFRKVFVASSRHSRIMSARTCRPLVGLSSNGASCGLGISGRSEEHFT